MNLLNFYEDSEEMMEYLNQSPQIIKEDNSKWNSVVENHLIKVYESSSGIKLPSLSESMKWLNILKPLSSEDLCEKIIIVDFFTYCCINCEHILPYLKEVEEEFKDNPEIVMIGVHSPKFSNEKIVKNVQDAILRNNITHPVLHDQENSLWTQLGVYCWPTVLIISPEHLVLFSLVGEDQVKLLSHLLHQTIHFIKSKKIHLNLTPVPVMPSVTNRSQILKYPTYISNCEEYFIVSDSGNNRLVLMSFTGEILDIIGCGKPGFADGSFSEAAFNNPHGTAYLKKTNKVFVADTGNHSIRQIDMRAKTVSSVFGMAERLPKKLKLSPEKESKEKFSSPWDLCIGPKLNSDMKELDVVYIAVAGSHQIWAMYLSECCARNEQYTVGTCVPFAGNGKEECRNNCYRMKAGFAQPSGITYSESDPGILYIADSESSTIRCLSLETAAVKTIVGGGLNPEDLFQFGDSDGKALNVKLQHPLAVCAIGDGQIYVADTYNNKVKLVDSRSRECKTIVGREKDDLVPENEFSEPSGICYLKEENILLVCDTNNHCIKSIDLKNNIIKKLNVHMSEASVDGPRCKSSTKSNLEKSATVKLHSFRSKEEVIQVLLNSKGEVHCYFTIESEGLSLTEESYQPWKVSFKGKSDWQVICSSGNLFHKKQQPSLLLKCFETFETCDSEVELEVNVSMCDDVKKTCLSARARVRLKVTTVEDGCETFILKLIL